MNKIINLKMKSTICAIAALFLAATSIKAQDKSTPVTITTKADLVSSYVWRGMYESGASVQPTLGMNAGNFSLTGWGSVDVTGQGYKETDFTAAYAIKGVTVSLTDYWWAGQSGIYNTRKDGKNNYFQFDNHTTDHILEGGLSYTLPSKSLPLTLSWNTMFWGADKKTTGNGKTVNAYSSYAEVDCPFTVDNTAFLASVGCSPFKSPANYKNTDFAVTNISLRATREIKINDKFSLPIFSQLTWNPNREDVHFVFGVTLQ